MPSSPISTDQDYQGVNRPINVPPATAPGQVATFEQLSGGNPLAAYEGSVDFRVSPSATNTITIQGGPTSAVVTTGTISHPAFATTNYLTSQRRALLTSAATAGSFAAQRQQTIPCWRGNGLNRGGFRRLIRVGLEVSAVGHRGFFGVVDTISAPGNIDPLTSTANGKVGIGFNTNTGNWQFVNNVAGTLPTIQDLGANFAQNVTDQIELDLRHRSNGPGFDWIVTNRATGNSVSGSATTNIPSNTAQLFSTDWMCNNTAITAVAFSFTVLRFTTPN